MAREASPTWKCHALWSWRGKRRSNTAPRISPSGQPTKAPIIGPAVKAIIKAASDSADIARNMKKQKPI